MRRPEMGWQQENRRSYYEGYYRAQACSYSVKGEKELRRASLDAILFGIIKGLLVCLCMVIILATLCSAAPSTEQTAQFPKINSYSEQYCSGPRGGGSYGMFLPGDRQGTKSASGLTSPEFEKVGLSDGRYIRKTDEQANRLPFNEPWR